MFGAYHKSGMGTVKWHMLSHVSEQIVRNSCSFLGVSGLYKYSHIISKQEHQKTSKRISKAMDYSLALVERGMCDDALTTTRKRHKNQLDKDEQELLSVTRLKSFKDCTTSVRRAHITPKVTELEDTSARVHLQVFTIHSEYNRRLPDDYVDVSSTFTSYIYQCVGKDDFPVRYAQIVMQNLSNVDVVIRHGIEDLFPQIQGFTNVSAAPLPSHDNINRSSPVQKIRPQREPPTGSSS